MKLQDIHVSGKVLEEIYALAKEYGVSQVILFGSRARGDNKERSDIDLAVIGGNVAKFSISVDEETSTLLKFDIVDLSLEITDELRNSIEKEGITIYPNM